MMWFLLPASLLVVFHLLKMHGYIFEFVKFKACKHILYICNFIYLISFVEKHWLKLICFITIWFSFLLVSFKFMVILGRVKIRFNIFVLLTKKSGPGRSPGEGNGNPFQYSCLKNPMDRGAWRALFQRITTERLRTAQCRDFRGKIMNLL